MMERVEVLKGPSALLNGMPTGNAVGGTANIVSKRAPDEPLTRIGTSYATRSQLGVSADVGRRFGADKAFGLRFNGTYLDGGLAVDPIEEKRRSAVLGLDYRGERFRVSSDLGYQRADTDSANRPISIAAGVEVPRPPRNDESYLPSWLYWISASRFGMVQGEWDLSKDWTAYGALGKRHAYAQESLFVNPSVQNADGDFTATPFRTPGGNKATSGLAGLRGAVTTGAVRHALSFNLAKVEQESLINQTGGAAFTSNLYAPVDPPETQIVVGKPARSGETERYSIGIADTLSAFEDRAQLTVGARRQKVSTDNFDFRTGAKTSSYDSKVWTPAYAITLRLLRNLSVYANYIEGLQPGTVVGTQFQNAGEEFAPYQSKQREAGLKVDWSGTLVTTLSVFQIAQPSTVQIPGDPLPTLALDGEQRNRGIEANVFGEPLTGLRLTGGLMLIDAELRRTQGGTNDGNQAIGVPDWQATLSGEWDVRFLAGLSFTGRVKHSDGVFLEAANLRTVPSWTQVDAGARYRMVSPWNGKPAVLRLSVENVLDENAWIARTVGSLQQTPPRTLLLSATFDF